MRKKRLNKPPNSELSTGEPMSTTKSSEFFGTIAALSISLFALGISIVQAITSRANLELSQRPYLEVLKSTDSKNIYIIKSLGNTPAHDVRANIGCVLFNGKYFSGQE